MAKLIIGFAGEMASGKTHSARYLMEKYGAAGCRFSTAMRDVLKRLYIPESRYSNQAVSLALRQAFGDGVWANVVAQDAKKIETSIVVIDGIRRPADIEPFRDDPNFLLVYIKADFEKRFERISKRGENADDIGKTREQFLDDQKLEAEQQIRLLEPLAKVVIENNGSVEELNQALDKLVA
jgi:dephospho-CoA kinase